MKIEIGDYKGLTVIALSGEIDMYSSPELREEMMTLIKQKISPVFVNLKDVTYIDSSGIATFVEGLKIMMRYSGSLKFISIPEGIMEIFNFSKLDKVFEIYRNIDDALGD